MSCGTRARNVREICFQGERKILLPEERSANLERLYVAVQGNWHDASDREGSWKHAQMSWDPDVVVSIEPALVILAHRSGAVK